MKAAAFLGKHRLEVQEVEIPRLKPDEVLVKVKACPEVLIM